MDIYDSRAAISEFLFRKSEPERVDLAFVLCSPTISSIHPAISLYKSGLTKRVLISRIYKNVDAKLYFFFLITY